jgi:hypothetical protein
MATQRRTEMIPITQTIFTTPGGNCMAACIASILELPLGMLPNPQGGNGEWYLEWQAWLRQYNLQILVFEHGGEWIPTGYSILCGKSPRGDWRHAVVCFDGAMVHDPHPDRTGVESRLEWTVFTVVDPSKVACHAE